jgi:hypothetical protein
VAYVAAPIDPASAPIASRDRRRRTTLTTWHQLSTQAPTLAAFVAQRLDDERTGRLSFLSTVRADGGPRVHPVKVFLAVGEAYVFMWGGSPKGADLQRDPRFALHTAVTPNPFDSGEAALRGTAELVVDAGERAVAAAAAPFAKAPSDDSVLYRLRFDHVIASLTDNGVPLRLRWRAQDGTEQVLPFPTDS